MNKDQKEQEQEKETVQMNPNKQANPEEEAAQKKAESINAINRYVDLLHSMLEGDDRLKGLSSQFIKTIEIIKPEFFPKKEQQNQQ